jgi:hypothetical protein
MIVGIPVAGRKIKSRMNEPGATWQRNFAARGDVMDRPCSGEIRKELSNTLHSWW